MMPEKASKTGPDLVGQHDQKVWLRIKRKHAQQRGAGCQPGGNLCPAPARHVMHSMDVGPPPGAGWVSHARAG